MASLILLNGPPASGKSTLARRFVEVVLEISEDEARSAFQERSAAGVEQIHRDAAMLVSRSDGSDPLGQMYRDLRTVVEQRPATRSVAVIRGDVEATFARLCEVVG